MYINALFVIDPLMNGTIIIICFNLILYEEDIISPYFHPYLLSYPNNVQVNLNESTLSGCMQCDYERDLLFDLPTFMITISFIYRMRTRRRKAENINLQVSKQSR